MRIAFDIDDCITQTTQTFCKYYKSIYGKDLHITQLTSRSAKFEDTGLVTSSQVRKIKDNYHKDRIFRKIEAYPGSVDNLKNLDSEKIYFITTRNDYFQNDLDSDTRYWFYSNSIYNYDLIITQDKPTILKALEIELFVEDNLSQIDRIRNMSNDLRIIVPSRPWNAAELSLRRDLIPMVSWSEFKYILT